MSVYRVRSFSRWARKQRLPDAFLCHAVHEVLQGLYEADLGGGILKKRVARPGRGKSGGFRTIIATNCSDRGFSCMVLQKTSELTLMMSRKLRSRSWQGRC
jgi:hypothetical protein